MANLVMLDLNDTLIGSHREDGFVTTMDEWYVLDGAVEAVRALQEAGFETAVVTNQPAEHRLEGVTHDQMRWLMLGLEEWTQRELHEPVFFDICYHDKQHGCLCRKPGTKLLLDAMARADAAPRRDQVWMVGDKASDMEAGRAVGTNVLQVYKTSACIVADWYDTIADAAGRIIRESTPCA